MYENPNLISRILRRESPVIPLFKYHSCPDVFEYLEDLEFDKKFELSLFRSKSETSLFKIVFHPLRLSKLKSLLEVVFYSLKLEYILLSEESKSESNFDRNV